MLLVDPPTSMTSASDKTSVMLGDIVGHLGKQQSKMDQQLVLIEQVAARQVRLEGLLTDLNLNLPSLNSPRRRCPTDFSFDREMSVATQNEASPLRSPVAEEIMPTELQGDCSLTALQGEGSATAAQSDDSPFRDTSFISLRLGGRRSLSKVDIGAERSLSPESNNETSGVRPPMKERLRAFILSQTFDLMMIIIIGVNILCVATEIELRGQHRGFALGVAVDGGPSWDSDEVFFRLEVSFTCIYWVEIMLRVWAVRGRLCKSAAMMYDFGVVLLCSFDIAMRLGSVSLGSLNLGVLLRQTRVIRAVKVLRLMHNFRDLQVILTTLRRSVVSLFWSLLVLTLIIVFATIVMCEFIRYEIDDASFDIELRKWAFEHFGTTSRGLLTMFEVTFSTKWVDISRPLTVDFSAWYGIFWVAYVAAVNFATIRILGAMFIKEAMCASRIEEDREAVIRLKEREKVAHNLRALFKLADLDHSGSLEKEELETLLNRPDIGELLLSMGLSFDELFVVMQVCTMDDGTVDYEEFMDAALKMQASVKAMDTIQLAHSILLLKRQVESIKRDIADALGLLRGLGLRRTVQPAPPCPQGRLLGL